MFLYVHHVTYCVYNIREVAEYLERNFGMKPWRIDEYKHRGFRTVMYRVGKTILDFSEPIVDRNGDPVYDLTAAPKVVNATGRNATQGAGVLFVKMLRERGPGIFHVAWAVGGIDKLYDDLKKKGNMMDDYGHDSPMHDSTHGFYKVFNILPTSISPSFDKAIRGQFFQCAEGDPSPEDLAE